MHHLKWRLGVTVVLAILCADSTVAADISRDDIGAWLGEAVVVDPPVGGTIVQFDQLHTLKPWIAPGFYEEFEFPEVTVELQDTADYLMHQSYIDATESFRGQPTIGADGRLENYLAGQPFSADQIASAEPDVGGYMLAWDQIHRWQYYGYNIEELTMSYLDSSSNRVPLDPKTGLNGGGNLERSLTQSFHRVYLNKLAMLSEQDYRIEAADSTTRLFKDFIEFLDPFNVKGTKFVIERMLDPHADDQVNSYFPTERRVRRISAQERADSFMGSNATLDDFEGFSGRVLDYKWTYLGQKTILNVADTKHELQPTFGPQSRLTDDRWQVRDCHVVELKSVWDGHPYRSRVLFIDAQTFSVTLSLIFNHDNILWKTIQPALRGPRQAGGGNQALETSVQSWRSQVYIDRLADTATVVRSLTDTVHPTMEVAAIKRIFSVSSLTSGN
jgi:hypothetical protein